MEICLQWRKPLDPSSLWGKQCDFLKNWHVLQILAHLFDLKRRAWNNLQLHLSLSHYMSSKKNQLLLSLIFFLSSKYLLSTQCNSNSSHQNNVKMIPKHENMFHQIPTQVQWSSEVKMTCLMYLHKDIFVVIRIFAV